MIYGQVIQQQEEGEKVKREKESAAGPEDEVKGENQEQAVKKQNNTKPKTQGLNIGVKVG